MRYAPYHFFLAAQLTQREESGAARSEASHAGDRAEAAPRARPGALTDASGGAKPEHRVGQRRFDRPQLRLAPGEDWTQRGRTVELPLRTKIVDVGERELHRHGQVRRAVAALAELAAVVVDDVADRGHLLGVPDLAVA